jgi:hypothetical protein
VVGLEWVSVVGAAPAVGGGRRSSEPSARGGPGGLTSGRRPGAGDGACGKAKVCVLLI